MEAIKTNPINDMNVFKVIEILSSAMKEIDETQKKNTDSTYLSILAKLLLPSKPSSVLGFELAIKNSKKRKMTKDEAVASIKDIALYLLSHFPPVLGISLEEHTKKIDEIYSRYLATMLLLTIDGISDKEIVDALRAGFEFKSTDMN